MDFLDPRTKLARRQKIVISYILMGLLALAAAVILLGSSFGYSINTKTGQIVQNGLVFVGANVKAHIILNGSDSGKLTDSGVFLPGPTRLVLESGKYNMELSLNGYRSWSTNFTLATQQLLRFDYPILIPKNLKSRIIASLPTGSFLSESPDSRLILVIEPGSKSLAIMQYASSDLTKSPSTLELPVGTTKFAGGSWSVDGWSSDSSALLLTHSLGSRQETILFNRTKPASSLNLTSILPAHTARIEFRDGSTSQFYVTSSSGNLSVYDSSSRQNTQIATQVTTISQLRSDRLIFATTTGARPGHFVVKVWDGIGAYTLSQLPSGGAIVGADSFNGNDYYLAGSSTSGGVTIYKNPLPAIKAGSSPPVLIDLMTKTPQSLYIAPLATGKAVAVRSGNSYVGYDFERQAAFRYTLKTTTAGPIRMLDDYHLTALSNNGIALMWDINGDNTYQLLAANLSGGVYTDSAAKQLITLSGSSAHPQLRSTSLVITSD